MALVSLAELKTYMDISLTNRQMDAVDFVLAGLQSELETYLRRPVELTEFTEVIRLNSEFTGIPMSSFFTNSSRNESSFYGTNYGTNAGGSMTTWLEPPMTVYVENAPIISVSSVTYQALRATSGTLLVEETDYVVRKFGVDVYRASSDDKVTIVYTAGLNGTTIPIFKLMILRAATREIQNMHDDVVGLKDLETRNVAPLTTGFMESELMALKKFRRNRI